MVLKRAGDERARLWGAGPAEGAREVRDRLRGLRRHAVESLNENADRSADAGGSVWRRQAAALLTGEPGSTLNATSGALSFVPLRFVTGYGADGFISGRFQCTDRVAELKTDSDQLIVQFSRGRDRQRVVLSGSDEGETWELAGHDRRWMIGLGQLADSTESNWRLVVVEASGVEYPVLAPLTDPTVRRTRTPNVVVGIAAEPLANLEWKLTRQTAEVYLPVTAGPAPTTLSVSLPDRSSGDAVQLRLHHPVASLQIPVSTDEDGVARVRLDQLQRYGTRVPLRTGSWLLEALQDGRWLGVGTRSIDTSSVLDEAAGIRADVRLGPTGVNIRSVELPRTDGPWGRTQAKRARQIPARHAGRPLRPAMVFECFWGRQASGNPLALVQPLADRLPDFTRYWVVNPGYTYAPPGMEPLVRWTEEWYDVMASSALVVTNAALAPYFRRRDDQVVLQTWHGTPLKRLGLDMLSFEHMGPGYQSDLVKQTAQWSHLVSPNTFCSEVFPQAFGYSGPLLEFGSPRNDVLVNDEGANSLAQIRSGLGIDADAPVVLVAPTFRDGIRKNGAIHTDVGVDLDELARKIGDDAVVLFRAHNYVASMDTRSTGAQVLNVSDYPDIARLYRIADLLVTDYSSVMFDYSVTGRPMVFHCPDLEDYRDRLRGFYFDFEGTAPGPITTDADGLADAVVDGLRNGVSLSYTALYDDFVKRYAGWEQGSAAQRIADVIAAEVAPG